jgi:hypothetical protein
MNENKEVKRDGEKQHYGAGPRRNDGTGECGERHKKTLRPMALP